MTREEHAQQRRGMIGASVAHTIMRGTPKGWASLIKRLWEDDGTQFAVEVGGARGFGHTQEAAGAAKFWERHPEFELMTLTWLDANSAYIEPEIAALTGCSPDRLVIDAMTGNAIAGLEVKSPENPELFDKHLDGHIDQIQHSMLVPGATGWWFVVHNEERYEERLCLPDEHWRNLYVPRLRAFVRQYNEGVSPTRRKVRMSDLTDI